MSLKSLSYRFAFLLSAVILFAVFNFLVCHPVQYVMLESKPVSWTLYSNIKYGFTVDIPDNWETRENEYGVEFYDGSSRRFISVKALPESSSMTSMPVDEYAFEYFHERHPYLIDGTATLTSVKSLEGISGFQIDPKIDQQYDYAAVQEPWINKSMGRNATLTYFPAAFAGDEFVSFVEVFTIGSADSTYERVVSSFNHKFKKLNQEELLAMRLVDPSETPHKSLAYVGEDRGFYIDLDGDKSDELIMICMRRATPDEKEKVVLKVFRTINGKFQNALTKVYSENSFHESDIKIVNIDNKPGYDVFLRFFEYGNEWGKNNNVLLFHDGTKFRAADFGAFADVRDVDENGVDEVITSTNTYFSLGAVSSWYDIYNYSDGDFKENNLLYKNYFSNVILPAFQKQVEAVNTEMNISKVQSFRTAAFRLTYRLNKYINWAKMIADGKDIPYR
jgi:hypothetical protein